MINEKYNVLLVDYLFLFVFNRISFILKEMFIIFFRFKMIRKLFDII